MSEDQTAAVATFLIFLKSAELTIILTIVSRQICVAISYVFSHR